MKINKIKAKRYLLGISQKDAAEKLGITEQAYSNKERGISKFSDDEKLMMKKMFGLDLAEWSDLFYEGKLPLKET